MPKYYVKCGRVREVVDRESRERAAYDVVQAAAYSGDGRMSICSPLNSISNACQTCFGMAGAIRGATSRNIASASPGSCGTSWA